MESVKTKTTTFNVSRPTATLTVGTQDKEKGTVEVTVSNIQSKSGINKVLIPVWSQQNQSDLGLVYGFKTRQTEPIKLPLIWEIIIIMKELIRLRAIS